MNAFYNLGVKLGAHKGRRAVASKVKTKKDGKTVSKALHQSVGNQQEPYRYGQKVKTTDRS